MFWTPLCSWNIGELGLGKFRAKNGNLHKWKPPQIETWFPILNFICLEFISSSLHSILASFALEFRPSTLLQAYAIQNMPKNAPKGSKMHFLDTLSLWTYKHTKMT